MDTNKEVLMEDLFSYSYLRRRNRRLRGLPRFLRITGGRMLEVIISFSKLGKLMFEVYTLVSI